MPDAGLQVSSMQSCFQTTQPSLPCSSPYGTRLRSPGYPRHPLQTRPRLLHPHLLIMITARVSMNHAVMSCQ